MASRTNVFSWMPISAPSFRNILSKSLLGVLFLAAAAGPALFWRGGVLEVESISFITNYTTVRPLLSTVFDPAVNDFGCYQARELSYLIDYFDAQIYAAHFRTFERPLIVSMSGIVASVAICAIFLAGARRTMPGVDPLTALLIAGCFVSSFQFISTMGVYYRSSKPWLMLTVLAFLFHVRRVDRERAKGSRGPFVRRDAILGGLLALTAGLLDRQGFFYACIAVVLLGLHYWQARRLGDTLVAVTAAVVVLVAYNVAIGPAIIHAVNGYWPNFDYQRMSINVASLYALPWRLYDAVDLLLENTGGMFGALRSSFAVLLLVAGAAAMLFRRGRLTRSIWLYGGLTFVAQWLMFGLMLVQHPPLSDWVDHRYWYYPLPFLATVMFLAAMGLDTVGPRLSRRYQRVVQIVLAACIASNIANLDRHRAIMRTGEWFGPIYGQSERLKASLRQGVADPQLDKPYRTFFEYHQQRLNRAR